MMVASPTERMHIGRRVGRIPARWGAGDPPCRSTSCSPVVAGAICARRPTWRGRRSAAGAATPRCRSPGRRPRGRQVLWLFAGVRDVFRAEVILSILLGALVVSCTLAIPVVGAVVGLALLAAAAVVYREVIRLSGLQGAPVPPGTGLARLAGAMRLGPGDRPRPDRPRAPPTRGSWTATDG